MADWLWLAAGTLVTLVTFGAALVWTVREWRERRGDQPPRL
jgi:hypothetical protein